MQSTFKRALAVILTVCLLLSVMLPAVSAETAEESKTAVYNLEYQTAVDELSTELKDGGNGLYKNGVLSEKIVGNMNTYYAGTEYGALNWKYAALSMSGNVEFDTGYSMMAKAQVGDWIALWIKSPGAGTYNVSLTYYGTTSGASESQVYIIPMAADTQDLEAAILAGMTEANLVNKDQTVSFCDSNGSSEKPSKNSGKAGYEAVTAKIGTLTDDGSVTDYILVLKATAQTTVESKQPCAYMYPAKLTLAEGEIEEEEEAPTLVGYETVAEDVVKSATCSVATTSVVNGHDYMYMFMRGSVLLVYDLDTKELVDIKTNAFSTPRCAVVDSKGIVWGGGAGKYLYRYDPIAKTGEQISFSSDLFPNISSFNLLGLSVDENDNLYFGTYNVGYLGMYDQQTGQFSRLSDWLNASDTLEPDAMYAGWGRVIVKDGYIYASVDGDKNNDDVATHQIIKYSIAEQKIVHHLDLTEHWGIGGTYLKYMNLVGDKYLLAGSDSIYQRIIELCGYAGCPRLVFHPISLSVTEQADTPEYIENLNMHLFEALIPTLIRCNVTACLENLYIRDDIKLLEGAFSDTYAAAAMVDRLNEKAGQEVFGICIDTGHVYLVGKDMRTYLPVLGKRIKALHINDNDGVYDLHQTPLSGRIDWKLFCQCMKEIGYEEDLSFEADGQIKKFLRYDPELLPYFLTLMCKTGENFRRKIQT